MRAGASGIDVILLALEFCAPRYWYLSILFRSRLKEDRSVLRERDLRPADAAHIKSEKK